MDELKACPFCGSARYVSHKREGAGNWRVVCEADGCGASCHGQTRNRQGSRDAWNRRADDAGRLTAEVERLKADRDSIIGRHLADGEHFKCHGILALFKKDNAALTERVKELEGAAKLARSYIGSLTGKEVPGMKGLAAIPVLFAIDKALQATMDAVTGKPCDLCAQSYPCVDHAPPCDHMRRPDQCSSCNPALSPAPSTPTKEK